MISTGMTGTARHGTSPRPGAPFHRAPPARRVLNRAQMNADAPFQLRVPPVEVVLQEHVFGRDGGVRLQLEHPVPVALLSRGQRPLGVRDSVIEAGVNLGIGGGAEESLARHHIPWA